MSRVQRTMLSICIGAIVAMLATFPGCGPTKPTSSADKRARPDRDISPDSNAETTTTPEKKLTPDENGPSDSNGTRTGNPGEKTMPGQKTSSDPDKPKAERLTADALLERYENNALTCRDHIFEVEGTIQQIDRRDDGVLLIKFKTKRNEGLTCYFHAKFRSDLEKLGKGNSLVVRGLCTDKGRSVLLEKCSLITGSSATSTKG